MSTALVTTARIAVPADTFDLVAALIDRLGGKVTEDSDSENITVPPMPEKERVGRMLKGLRLRAELSQQQLADAIGVPQSHISEYELNRRSIPAAKAEELARVLSTVPTHFQRRAD